MDAAGWGGGSVYDGTSTGAAAAAPTNRRRPPACRTPKKPPPFYQTARSRVEAALGGLAHVKSVKVDLEGKLATVEVEAPSLIDATNMLPGWGLGG